MECWNGGVIQCANARYHLLEGRVTPRLRHGCNRALQYSNIPTFQHSTIPSFPLPPKLHHRLSEALADAAHDLGAAMIVE